MRSGSIVQIKRAACTISLLNVYLPYIEGTIIILGTSSNIFVHDESEDTATRSSEVRNICVCVCMCVSLLVIFFKEVLRLLGNFTCTLRYVVLPQY